MEGGLGPRHRLRQPDRRQGVRPPGRADPRLDARQRRPLRRAARRPLFDEVGAAQALHRRQQSERHQPPAGRHRRERPRRPPGPPGDHGRLRLHHGGPAHPRGLSEGHGRHRPRPDRAGNPVPAEPRQHLSHDQDAGRPAVPVLRQERRPADHRPAPGHRLGRPDRGDPAGRAPDQPLRLRRRLRHGAEPLPDAGRAWLSADGAWLGRPDAGLHPYPGHGALRRAGAEEPAQARRPGQDPQPDDREPPRPRPGADGGRDDRRPGPQRRQSAPGGRRERTGRRQ